ncbi:MAG: hypothetical protein ACP5JC_01450 [Candidatus Micrarchaeia archaeon]
MLISPYKPIKELKYLIWDLTGTIDALPLKLMRLSTSDKKHLVWRYKDLLCDRIPKENSGNKRRLERTVKKLIKSIEAEQNSSPLHSIITIGSYVVQNKILSKHQRNTILAELFKEIADSVGFIEKGYNEHVADFICSRKDFFHYLITNLPKEPAEVVLSRMDLFHAFKERYFYVIKSREVFQPFLLQNIIKNRCKSLFLVIGDEYFKEIMIAHEIEIPTAWINPGSIRKEHYFHPELVASSPNELVFYLNENYF